MSVTSSALARVLQAASRRGRMASRAMAEQQPIDLPNVGANFALANALWAPVGGVGALSAASDNDPTTDPLMMLGGGGVIGGALGGAILAKRGGAKLLAALRAILDTPGASGGSFRRARDQMVRRLRMRGAHDEAARIVGVRNIDEMMSAMLRDVDGADISRIEN